MIPPSPEKKAKAVYYGLISHVTDLIKAILEDAPDEFKYSEDFRNFVDHEIGEVMFLNSSKTAYEYYFADYEESKKFTNVLLSLFLKHYNISEHVLNIYLRLIEGEKEPQKKISGLFAGHIIAYINKDDECFLNGKWTRLYSQFPETIAVSYPEMFTYLDHYLNIVKVVGNVLNICIGPDANSNMVIELSDKLDKFLASIK